MWTEVAAKLQEPGRIKCDETAAFASGRCTSKHNDVCQDPIRLLRNTIMSTRLFMFAVLNCVMYLFFYSLTFV